MGAPSSGANGRTICGARLCTGGTRRANLLRSQSAAHSTCIYNKNSCSGHTKLGDGGEVDLVGDQDFCNW